VLRFAAACVSGLLSLPLQAHDLWITPATFTPQRGEVAAVRLHVGVALQGEVVPAPPRQVMRFFVRDGLGQRSVAARPGTEPAGQFRVQTEGLQVLGYQSQASHIELAAEVFNPYLIEEGLEAIAQLRRDQGRSDKPAREAYSRCAKALLQVGPVLSTEFNADALDLGCTLELVPLRNPYAEGDELPFRLTYRGRALPGALVVAVNTLNPKRPLSARSDADGRVALGLPRGGMWLVKAVHMVAAEAGADVDWRSTWASVTFER
jgi:Domain of unknown function (DUF4198)